MTIITRIDLDKITKEQIETFYQLQVLHVTDVANTQVYLSMTELQRLSWVRSLQKMRVAA